MKKRRSEIDISLLLLEEMVRKLKPQARQELWLTVEIGLIGLWFDLASLHWCQLLLVSTI